MHEMHEVNLPTQKGACIFLISPWSNSESFRLKNERVFSYNFRKVSHIGGELFKTFDYQQQQQSAKLTARACCDPCDSKNIELILLVHI